MFVLRIKIKKKSSSEENFYYKQKLSNKFVKKWDQLCVFTRYFYADIDRDRWSGDLTKETHEKFVVISIDSNFTFIKH